MSQTLSDHDLLARLVAFETVSSQPCDPLIDWASDYLDRPGIRLYRQASDEPGKSNLLAVAGPDDVEEGLTLCGHVDVVPADEPDWTSDPFTLTTSDDRYVARGACDMKGFDALAINRLIEHESQQLRRRLAVLLTFDEEVGSVGAKQFAEHWPYPERPPRSVLIGEPTEMRVVRMHKGHLKLRITVRGRAAHSGSPHLGINAIEPAGAILQALRTLREDYVSRATPHAACFDQVPYAVLSVARIAGGEALNVIPDRCDIDVGVRLMPGDESGTAIEEITECVSRASGATVEVTQINDNPPMLTGAGAPLYRQLIALLDQPEDLGVSYASDGGWLGRADYQCVLFGPGSIAVAHRPDEHMPIAQFERARDVLRNLIESQCVEPNCMEFDRD